MPIIQQTSQNNFSFSFPDEVTLIDYVKLHFQDWVSQFMTVTLNVPADFIQRRRTLGVTLARLGDFTSITYQGNTLRIGFGKFRMIVWYRQAAVDDFDSESETIDIHPALKR